MAKIIKDGVEYDFGSDIIYHLVGSGDSDDSGDSKDITFIDLGSGTSFDVSSYDGYENFTVDNFVVKEITETSISKLGYNSGTATAAQNAVNLKSTMELVKEYDSSTGILTCYIKHYAYVKSSNTSSDAVTLTDTQNAPVNVLLVLNGTSDGSGDANIDAVDTLNLGEPDYELSSGTFTAGWNTIQCGCKASIVIFQCHYGDYYGYGISDVEHGVYWNSFANSTLELLSCLENVRNVTDTSFDVMLTDSYDLIIDKLLVYSGSAIGSGNVAEEEKILLWENASPTTAFAAQDTTLSESANNFDWLEIHAWDSYGTYQDIKYIYRYSIDQLTEVGELYGSNTHGLMVKDSYSNIYTRPFVLKDGATLTWGVGYMLNSTTTDNARAIPYQIYGVKNGVTTTIDYADYYQQITMTAKTYSTFDLPVPLSKIGSVYIVNESYSTKTAVSYVKAYDEAKWHSGYNGIPYDLDTLDAGSVYKFNITENQFQFYTANAGTYGVYITGVSDGNGDSSNIVNYGDFESFAKFVNNCNTTMGGLEVYIDDFSKVKSFTYEVTATNYGSYIRYKNDSGTITNIFGDNYTEHGISAGKSATITKTVNCEELNFDVGYPVFWALGSSTNITNLKITSYEMVDGYTYPEAGGIGGNTTPTVQLPSGVTLTSNAKYRGNTSCSTYFIKGTEQAIFSTSCVNEEEKYKGQLASATSTITIENASGTTIHTQNITTNTNTTFTFDWDAYGCDIIFVTLSIADAQVTYYTSSVSIATV